MNEQSEEEDYARWVRAVNVCHAFGWRCKEKWLFVSPIGRIHDLSAANLRKLDYISATGLFLRNEEAY